MDSARATSGPRRTYGTPFQGPLGNDVGGTQGLRNDLGFGVSWFPFGLNWDPRGSGVALIEGLRLRDLSLSVYRWDPNLQKYPHAEEACGGTQVTAKRGCAQNLKKSGHK